MSRKAHDIEEMQVNKCMRGKRGAIYEADQTSGTVCDLELSFDWLVVLSSMPCWSDPAF
jgi:hypothetical protein